MGPFSSEFGHAHVLLAVTPKPSPGLETIAAQIPLADLTCGGISFSFNHLRRQHEEHAVPPIPREELWLWTKRGLNKLRLRKLHLYREKLKKLPLTKPHYLIAGGAILLLTRAFFGGTCR